ncbi:hypothetical protein DRF65_13790 [Chryseobacterium pennae]|uniref:Uncharacterized protein n=2 Tax=Chryseobacterium pennae TaxID=2258962 RepID=A0A3D9C8A4_9FLAO|nr:hypothetical protein DRF65_13790 [Chryseobacterium pennae]
MYSLTKNQTMKEKQILLREPFNEQYTLLIESEINGVDVYVTSKVQLRFDFHVLKIEDNHIEVRIVQLDNKLLETNSPMIKEVAVVSQIFGRMYNELHLILDQSGKVISVLNYDLILSKWKQTKSEMDQHIAGNPDLQQAIILNDNIFTDPEKIKIAVQANEFFPVYFGSTFGINLPASKSISGTNIFNTANMTWNMKIETPAYLSNHSESIRVVTRFNPKDSFTSGFYNTAYKQFEDKINITNLNVQLEQTETRQLDFSNGKLEKAMISKREIVDEKKLYNIVNYSMLSDSEQKNELKKG